MKKIIRLSAYALATVSLVGLASCGGGSSSGSKDPVVETTKYTITFNANGGANVASVTVNEGESIRTLPETTREGYTFEGWYLNEAFTEKVSGAYIPTSDRVFYAKWIEDIREIKYTVTYNPMGGNISGETTTEVEEGDCVAYMPTPTREGYKFGGWYYTTDFETQFTNDDSVSNNMTVYAKWIENKVVTHTITLVANGGSVSPVSVTVEDGKTASLPNPTRSGYSFLGWYTDSSFQTMFTSKTTVTADMILVAKWEKVALTFTINNLNNDGADAKIELSSESEYVKSLNIPKISGYTFAGLYSDSACTKRYNFANKVSTSTKLYAKWTENNTYTKMDTKLDITSYIDSLMDQTPSYTPAWNKESFKGRWNYIDGVFLKSVVNLYDETNNEKYKSFVHNYVNYYVNQSGAFVDPRSGSSSFASTELDSICESQILFALNDWYPSDTRYAKAIENSYNYLKNISLCSNGINYNHKNGYKSQVWLDGMYMYGPFLAQYANYKGGTTKTTLLTQLYTQYKYIYDHMRTPDGLYYHALDTRVIDQTNPISGKAFWADSETGLSESVWGRSMGWLIVSLVDVIEYYPEGAEKTFLNKMINEVFTTLSRYRDDKSKMYYELVDQGNKTFYVGKDAQGNNYLSKLGNSLGSIETYMSNYLESSCSSMFAYSMMKASQLGIVDSKYYAMGVETFEGTSEMYYNSQTNELGGIHITAGLGTTNSDSGNPWRDGTAAYYLAEPVGSNDAKGVGPYIMAFVQYKA